MVLNKHDPASMHKWKSTHIVAGLLAIKRAGKDCGHQYLLMVSTRGARRSTAMTA